MSEADAQAIDDLESAFSVGAENGLRDAHEAHGSLIYTFCRRFLDEDQAGLVTRDVFVEAWRDRARFDRSVASLGGWLMAIARDRVVAGLGRMQADDRLSGNAAIRSEVTQVGDRMLWPMR